MAALSFVAMYFLMYTMVDEVNNVFMNVNQVYMAGVMAAPMVLIELVMMREMYRDKRHNWLVVVAALAVGVLSFFGIRQQAAVGDRQFARSMIPHHASAILMCRQAPIRDASPIALRRREWDRCQSGTRDRAAQELSARRQLIVARNSRTLCTLVLRRATTPQRSATQ